MRSTITTFLLACLYIALGSLLFGVDLNLSIFESGKLMLINYISGVVYYGLVAIIVGVIWLFVIAAFMWLLARLNDNVTTELAAAIILITYPIIMVYVAPKLLILPEFNILEFLVVYIMTMATQNELMD